MAASSTAPAKQRLISHKKEFLEILVDKTTAWRSKMLADLGESIKEYMLADPDMWPSIRRGAKSFLEAIWQDIQQEVERGITSSVHHEAEFDNVPGPSTSCCFLPWMKIRAYVLHHYLPHDKSIFGKLKDPFYLVLYFLSFLPVHGVRVIMFGTILFMLLWPGQPDEFQLINFILLFKGFQFLTSGLLVMGYGAWKYYSCYTWSKHDLLDCMDHHGPAPTSSGATIGLLLDYAGSIILVWIAFAALSRSVNSVQELQQKLQQDQKEESDNDRYRRMRLERALKQEGAQGGRLRALLVWDRRCFLFSLALLVASIFTCGEHFEKGETWYTLLASAQFRTNVYWCCDVYAVLSIPFALFCIPGLMEILTHSDYTGFNKHGACVYWDYLPKPEPVVLEEEKQEEPTKLDKIAKVGVKIVRTIERGQESRGADTTAEYKFGDFTRGLVASYFPKSEKAAPAESEAASSSSGMPSWMQRMRNSLTGDETSSPAGALYGEPFHVASVRIPRVEEGHPTYYFIEVTPYCNFGEHADPWHVKRRYNDFKDLEGTLGRGSQFKDAAFPDRQFGSFGKLTGEALEARRAALELWLGRVIQEPSVQDKWATPLRDFLQAPAALAEEDAEVPTALAASEPVDASGTFASSLPPADEQPLEQVDSWVASAGASPSSVQDDTQTSTVADVTGPTEAPAEVPPSSAAAAASEKPTRQSL